MDEQHTYQSLLLNPPRVRFHPSAALNPSTLLPDPDLGAPLHDCAGILEQIHGFRTDLTDQPLPDNEATWFTDGSSFVRDGHSLRAELIAEFKDQELFLSLRGLQRAHEDIWPRLRAIYEAGPTPTPHQYRPGDWVYIKRHHRETLEPHWNGPYIVVLTTPTALKVDGSTTWVHHTHVRPADPSSIQKDFVTRWTINRDQHNPLKFKLQHIRPT
ncbi:Hypothetical predicted protein [Lynx pardinus]|uniref:Murine leukemia virus integrase C-terminal domain-containing protein n=1 Tax=Lynx pardinus TaxID=191816 RepID=A0A485P4X7_LYNPA|nr:Hypothetical predicted protein [Lynx pardinus]